MTAAIAKRIRAALLLAAATLLPPSLYAAGPTTQPEGAPAVEPVLPADPEVVRILDELGDNSYAKLPPANIHGEFNAMARQLRLHERGPGSRDYCLKMPWSPDRKRALYAGGNHGAPHKINDVWEYDLDSNTWVLLSNPDYNARRGQGKPEQLTYRDGVLMTRNGNLVVGGHTFSGFTYDAKARLLLWYHKTMTPKTADRPEPDKLYKGPMLWAFDPYARKWQHIRTNEPWPRYDPGSALNYLPHLGKSLWSNNRTSSQLWLYDHAARSWEKLPAKGEYGQWPRMSSQKVYDPANNVLVAHGGHSNYTSEYSFADGTWRQTVEANKEQTNAPYGADKLSAFVYDSVNGVCLLSDNLGGYMWVYDAKADKWERLTPENSRPDYRGTSGIQKGQKLAPMGFFHPDRNVLVLSDGGKEVWVYRYKRRVPGDPK